MGTFPNKATQFKKNNQGIVKINPDKAKAGRANKNNPQSIIGQRIRRIKESGEMTPEQADMLFAKFNDPSVSAFDMYDKLETAWKNKELTTKDFLHFKDRYHRTTHGDKLNITQKNVNINVELSAEEADELLEMLNKE